MKRTIFFYVITGVALFSCLATAFFVFKSPSQLFSPPNVYGESAEAEEAFKDFLGNVAKNMTLKYPTEGKYQTPYVKYDLDGDGENEILVFYSLDNTTVRFHVLDRQDGEWTSIYDDEGYGSGIVSVAFDDLGADGKKEILLGWTPFEGADNRTLTIHALYEDENQQLHLRTLVNQSYLFMAPADMDDDNIDEVLVVSSEPGKSGNVQNTATLLKMTSSGSIRFCGKSVPLDSSVSAYDNLQMQTKGKTNIAFLDAYKGEEAMATELLWWDKEKEALMSSEIALHSNFSNRTLRSPAVPCVDLDDDGYLEIPAQNLPDPEEWNGEKDSEKTIDRREVELFSTNWSTFKLKNGTPTFQTKRCGFVDTQVGYTFCFRSDYADELYAYRNSETGVVTIYLGEENHKKAKPLFSLVASNAESLVEKDMYTFSKKNGNTAIYGTLTSDGAEAGFTNELIEDSIIFYH